MHSLRARGFKMESWIVLGIIFIILNAILLFHFLKRKTLLLKNSQIILIILLCLMTLAIISFFYFQDKMRSFSDPMAGAGYYSSSVIMSFLAVIIFAGLYFSFYIAGKQNQNPRSPPERQQTEP